MRDCVGLDPYDFGTPDDDRIKHIVFVHETDVSFEQRLDCLDPGIVTSKYQSIILHGIWKDRIIDVGFRLFLFGEELTEDQFSEVCELPALQF